MAQAKYAALNWGISAALSCGRLRYGMRGPLTVACLLVETEADRTEHRFADAARLGVCAAYVRTAIGALPSHWLRAWVGLASCHVLDFEDFTICQHGVVILSSCFYFLQNRYKILRSAERITLGLRRLFTNKVPVQAFRGRPASAHQRYPVHRICDFSTISSTHRAGKVS
jgi:hypothetical protein